MQLWVNDEPQAMRIAPQQTLRQLAQMLCPAEAAEPRLVVSVACDGHTVPPDRLDATLDTPAGRFGQVAFQIQPVRALVAQSLAEAVEVFRAADRLRIEAADLIAAGHQQPALERLGQLLAHWQQVQETVALSVEALNSPLEALCEADPSSPRDVLARITEQLRELKAALESGDLVLVGDVLRFELDPLFAEWLRTLNQLESAAHKPHPSRLRD